MNEITQEDNGSKGRFFVKEGDDYIAQMVYTWTGTEKIIIEHTEVDEKLKGQGVGTKLLAALVAWARAQHLKIIPLCPFAKAMMAKNAGEYKDVLFGV